MSDSTELLTIQSGDSFQPFDWSVGRAGSRFLHELKENRRIVGIRCGGCQRVYIPPRKVCGRCWRAMDEFVPVADEGKIIVCAIVQFGFVDPSTGLQRPVPYTYILVQLDGATTLLPHFLDCTDPQRVQVGARVKAVWEDDRTGSLTDIRHFTLI